MYFLNKVFNTTVKLIQPFSKAHIHNQIREVLKGNSIGSEVSVKGWIKSLNKLKDIIFIHINDGSCKDKLQIVLDRKYFLKNLSFGSSVKVKGLLQANKNGQIELLANDIDLIGPCDSLDNNYPFQPKKTYPLEYIRKYPNFRSRTNLFNSLLRVRHSLSKGLHDFFNDERFILIHTPIITTNDCEGAGEIFLVKPENETLIKNMTQNGISPNEAYFNSKAYLTVSGQLHLETIVRGLSKVYSFGPTFRAENSNSRHHLSEFYMVEAELAFCETLDDLIEFINKLLKTTIKHLLEYSSDDIACFTKIETLEKYTNENFLKISYEEAIEILSSKLKYPITYGETLSKEQELALVKYTNDVPIFIVDWPKKIKPFYMKQLPEDTSKVAAFDLLVPKVGELIGGSVREDNYDILHERCLKNDLQNLFWYLEIRKYGNVPSSGFGLGFERYLQFLLDIPNIKDTIPFPRWPHNCKL